MVNSQFDQLHRYLFTDANVRGELVQLHQSFRDILDSQDYPPIVAKLMGELMAASSLLTATLKFEGDIALQLQSDGFIKYAVVNGTHDQKLRGVARWDESLAQLPETFADLFDKGVLVITITPKVGERYQGMVALDKPSLAECVEAYFEQSEQLPTMVKLATDVTAEKAACGGVLLQILPVSSEVSNLEQRPEFEHLCLLTKTLTDEELLFLPAETLLHRLYHQEKRSNYPSQDVVFKCSCSRERSAAAIASIDKQELLDIIETEGAVKLNCQYCHTEYAFDAIDVEAIHSGSFEQPSQAQ